MKDTITILGYVSTAAYAFLGLVAVVDWLRHRDRSHGYLALALGLLGLVGLLGVVNPLLGSPLWLTDVILVGFLGCGFALLMLRHTLIPLRRWLLFAAGGAFAVEMLLWVTAGFPKDPKQITPYQLGVVYALFVLWMLYIGEPAVRLWLVSLGRPAVQRARLRSLSVGYLMIVGILVIDLGASGLSAGKVDLRIQIFTTLLGIAAVPVLYVSFAPPGWLRRAWRAKEESAVSAALQDLLTSQPDATALADRALEWGLRLVGADGGAIVDADGSVLSRRDAPAGEVLELAATARAGGQVGPRAEGERRRAAMVVPLTLAPGDGYLVVVAGAFTPLFGGEERVRLNQYSAAISAALDRAKLVEALRASERDVRELNRDLERRVQERTAQLEASNRELEAFSYTVSHDLRAPLRAIDGFTRIIIEEHGDEVAGEAARYLGMVNRTSQEMGELIDALLSFSRLGRQALKLEPVSTDAIARRAADKLMAGVEGRRVDLRIQPLPDAQSDPLLLEQVFTNLVGNALKFSRERDPALVEVGSLEHGPGTQPETVYFVRDNGVGFDMRYADKLFGVFQRLHRSDQFEGTGAGLAIVQRIVHRHGGRIWAESEVGKGTTFSFTLGHGVPSHGLADGDRRTA